jgi:diguanylate cyclase (GGDEF)-like protein
MLYFRVAPFQRDVSLNKRRKRFFAIDLSAPAVREITDALVIFSISIISYAANADWVGLELLRRVFGIQSHNVSILYFFGAALVVFSVRRIVDQRRERIRRVAAEHHAYLVSIRDPLTQLSNRRHFETEVTAALKTSNKNTGILLLGLDQFKKLNDLYGHLGCDAAISQVAARIRDRVTAGDLLARVSDDEFALYLAHADAETAGSIALALVENVKEPVQIGIEYQSIGARVGIAQVGRGPVNAGELLRRAHVALSHAKTEQQEYCFFDPKMDDRHALQQDLRSAIARGELLLHYQPQARMTGETVGLEALVRWQCLKRGMILPSTFVPIAEESSLIIALDEWVLREACREAASWPQPLTIAVNISPIQFRHGDLPKLVLSILLETGLAPGRLELEITESVFINDFSRAVSVLRQLKSLGVQIALDDFGTGFSSLSYLHSFPFDKIKIDQTFIGDLKYNRHSMAVVRAVIGLGQSLDIPVLAEGVETKAQHALLVQEGCDEVQGHLTGQPLPIANHAELIGNQATAPKNYALAG